MIVVVIVAILVMVAIPLYGGRTKESMMSEGIAGIGIIRTQMRVYAANHNYQYPILSGADGSELHVISVMASDLEGKYFDTADYSVTSSLSTYLIRATLPSDSNFWYEMDDEGNVNRSYF